MKKFIPNNNNNKKSQSEKSIKKNKQFKETNIGSSNELLIAKIQQLLLGKNYKNNKQ